MKFDAILVGALTMIGIAYATATSAQTFKPKIVKRGEYLVHAVGCEGCHTYHKEVPDGPNVIDMTRYLAGQPTDLKVAQLPDSPPWVLGSSTFHTAHAGPWGVSFAANLTPDGETGLGNWTEAQFVATIRNGKVKGTGRPLLPPMPWADFRNFPDSDLKAIYAYLRSIPPIRNKVPEPLPPRGY